MQNSAPKYRTKPERMDALGELSNAIARLETVFAAAAVSESYPRSTKRERVLAWGAVRTAADAIGEFASDLADIA